MFIVTAHIPKRALISAGIGLFCCCVAVFAGVLALRESPSAPASAEVRGMGGEADRLDWLESLGWELADGVVLEESLLIPEEFDASYDEYLALQNAQGFDLDPYRGKEITRYTYEITNHPSGEDGILVSLLVYRSTIIGGEVLSPAADGFLHGLDMPTG